MWNRSLSNNDSIQYMENLDTGKLNNIILLKFDIEILLQLLGLK